MTYALAPSAGPMSFYSPSSYALEPSDVAALGPAGWHGPEDIETLVGLAGTYLWSENPYFTTQITFVFSPQMVGRAGTYTIQSLGAVIERGSFICVPSNFLVGALINLMPWGQATSRYFAIQGVMTDANWKIIIMVLNRMVNNGPTPPMFSAVRLV